MKRNIEAYNHWIYLGPFLLCLDRVCAAVRPGTDPRPATEGSRVNAQWVGGALLPLALAALIPFAWYFVAANHTYIHYWYAHRTLAVTAFAVPGGVCLRAPRQASPAVDVSPSCMV